MTFADLLAFLRAHDLVGFAPSLASRDILSVDALQHISETTLVQISPTRPDLDKMLAALGRRPMSRAVVPVARRDLPSSTPSARGSLSKALMAARPEFRDGRAVTYTHDPAVTCTQKFLVTCTHAHA